MKRRLLIVFTLCVTTITGFAQVDKLKRIDNGGSGPHKAIATSEKSLPDFVVYRPENIKRAVSKEGKLPVLVYANGGCANSSIHHERVLTEIASYGYVVIAIGALQMTLEERKHESTEAKMLVAAIDWITEQAENRKSEFYKQVDLTKIAAGGQSCGGAQILAVAGDPRLKTFIMLNSGMGDMTMAGASAASLEKLNGAIIYIVGGESDVATRNALLDYERIEHVGVAFANLLEGGHMGTFKEEFGGSFAKMAIDWLDWQFKGKDRASLFLEEELTNYPGWTMKAKNFN